MGFIESGAVIGVGGGCGSSSGTSGGASGAIGSTSSELRDGEDVAAVEVASISAAVPAPRSDGPFNGAASGVAESCQSVSLNARQGVGTHTH